MSSYDFVVVGAGIYGVTTALKLKEEGHTVAILNPDTIPHHLAASTDISKAVRVEYGSDLEYMDMAAECVEGWRDWNDLYRETLYHETGYILATSRPLGSDEDAYEFTSYQNLLKKGFKPERFDAKELEKRFPAFNTEQYIDGFFHAVGGFVLSGRESRNPSSVLAAAAYAFMCWPSIAPVSGENTGSAPPGAWATALT